MSTEHANDLRTLVGTAQGCCGRGAGLFINDAAFYPRLKPEYAALVPAYMQVARDAGAAVHDGSAFVRRVKMHDNMHLSKVSAEAVVQMYFAAIEQMVLTADARTESAPLTPG